MPKNDYTTQSLVDRLTLKAFTSSSSSLLPQQILDLCNDSLRSYIVPSLASFRDEWFIGKDDTVLVSDVDGRVTLPDTVASSMRCVSWSNNGVLVPLTRIEPELSFQYLQTSGAIPVGFELRGYTLQLLPKAPNVEIHITAMLRPPQMVLVDDAAEVASRTGAVLTLASVPLEWQEAAPSSVDVISSSSPFSSLGTFGVVSLTDNVLTLDADPDSDDIWVSDVDTAPFANIPIELYPLLEQDAIVQLFTGLGDKRLAGAEKRRDSLEAKAKKATTPRTTGNARPIVNTSAPGMRGAYGYFPRR